MNLRKLTLPPLVALACLGAGFAAVPAGAATKQPTHRSHKSQVKPKKLRIDSIRFGTKAGPLVIRVAADVKTELRMTVNGKRVETPFELAGPKAQTIELRTADGLRAGPNKVWIRGIRAGVVSKAARTIKVPGWALLADAGEDASTYTHVHAQVGTAPPPAAAGKVDYSWDIVRSPKGADPSLADGDDPEPVLETERPGIYVLQEEVDPEGNDDPTSFDRVTVPVAPADPPIGVSINTMGREDNIEIGDQRYAGYRGDISYVILERATRAVVDADDLHAEGPTALAKLTELADKYGSGSNYMRYTMIVSAPGGLDDGDQIEPLAALLKKLGVALPTVENFDALKARQPFSLIGIPGAPAGAATIRIAPAGYDPPVSAAITGYLQPNQAVDTDGAPLYEYVAGAQPSFETRAAGSEATVNKMVIDEKTYTGTLPVGATAGFHVVVLDSLGLQPISNKVLATNASTGVTRDLQAQTAKELKAAIEQPGGPLLFVQTIGKPAAAGPEWQGIVAALVRLGANAQLVNALDGTTEYALVSRLGAKAPPAEASTAFDKGPYPAPKYPPAALIGTLARSRTSNYVPNLFGTPTDNAPEAGINLALNKISYQPTQAWPQLPGGFAAETAKTEHFICEGMKFCLGANSCPTVRECFWQRYSADWGTELTLLQALKYPGVSKGFSERSFEAVKAELFAETADVANVKHYLTQLQEPFEKSDLSSYIDLQGISKKIYDSVQPPPLDNSTSWTLGLISKIIQLGSATPPPARYAAAGLSAVFGLASFLSNKSGQPILGSEVTARSSELASELVSRIDMARKTTVGLGMLIVSDYGKLTAADHHISTDWALPADIKPTIDAYRTSAKQWFYEALIPTAYPYLIRSNVNNARALACKKYHLSWENQPDMFQMNATVGYDEKGQPLNSNFFFAKGIGRNSSPPASLGDEMFRPRSGENPGLGIEKLRFFTPRLFGGSIYHAMQGVETCALGWLPRFE
jgi:hypothetical protein